MDYISNTIRDAHLAYMRQNEPSALAALQDGQEYPLLVATLLSDHGCHVLKRPYNLPSNLAAYNISKMKSLTVAVSMQLKHPTVVVTPSDVSFDEGSTIAVRRNEDTLKGQIGIGIPSIDLDTLRGNHFLELRAGTNTGEGLFVRFKA